MSLRIHDWTSSTLSNSSGSDTSWVKAATDEFLSVLSDGTVLQVIYYSGTDAISDDVLSNALPWPSTWNYGYATTLLQDGRILVCGGDAGAGAVDEVWIGTYTGTSISWAAASQMPVAKSYHVVLTLLDGRILLLGGADSSVYFGTVTGNSISWVAESNGLSYGYRSECVLSDGRILLFTDSTYAEIGTVSGTSITWAVANIYGDTYPYTASALSVLQLSTGSLTISGGEYYDSGSSSWVNTDRVFTAAVSGDDITLLDDTSLSNGNPAYNKTSICETSNGRVISLYDAYADLATFGFDSGTFSISCGSTTKLWQRRFQWNALSVGIADLYGHAVEVANNVFIAPHPGTYAQRGTYVFASDTMVLAGITDAIPIAVIYEADNPGTCRLLDGRIFYASGGVSGNENDETYLGTYSAPNVTWVSSTAIPETHEAVSAVTLSDGRVLVLGVAADSNYFGTVSGNSITWVKDTTTFAWSSGASPEAAILSDGRVLFVSGGTDFRIGTISGSAISWVPAILVDNPYSATMYSSLAVLSRADNQILLSGGYDTAEAFSESKYTVCGRVSGNTITFQPKEPTPSGRTYSSGSRAFEVGGKRVLVTHGTGLSFTGTDLDPPTTSASFSILSGSTAVLSWESIAETDFTQSPGSATSFVSNVAARQLAITEGSATHFVSCTKEGAFTISEGSTTALRIKDAVERFNFAIVEGSIADIRGSQIAGTRFSARAGSIFRGMPAFEWPSAIVSRCASRTAFRSVFQAPGDFAEAAGSATSFVAASRASAAFSAGSGSAAAFASRPMASTYFGAACQSAMAFQSRQFAGAVGAVPGASACAFVGSSSFTALPPPASLEHMLFVATTNDSEFLLERQ